MRQTHGQSNYTSTKQAHLQMILHAGTNGFRSVQRLNPGSLIVVIDCTAGSGQTDKGEAGSPVILNNHFHASYGLEFRQLCCERDRVNFDRLKSLPLVNTDFANGDYQDHVGQWLTEVGRGRLLTGLCYCDVNGMKDALDGLAVFNQMRAKGRFERIDLLFNISLNAYKRHQAVGSQWAMQPLLDRVDQLAGLKECSFIRGEIGFKEWIMLYGLNTKQVSARRRTAHIWEYWQEWRPKAESHLNGGLKVSPEQRGLFDETAIGI